MKAYMSHVFYIELTLVIQLFHIPELFFFLGLERRKSPQKFGRSVNPIQKGRLCLTHYCQPPTQILKATFVSTINYQLIKVAQINYVSRNQLHCRANLNFGLMCKKAKHYWALSTNFLFLFS